MGWIFVFTVRKNIEYGQTRYYKKRALGRLVCIYVGFACLYADVKLCVF